MIAFNDDMGSGNFNSRIARNLATGHPCFIRVKNNNSKAGYSSLRQRGNQQVAGSGQQF
jgi:hypothetical protein